MVRNLLLVLCGIVLVVVGFAAAGFRLERGGSGWPGSLRRSNDDVLEADRARQRAEMPALEAQDPAYKPIAVQEAVAADASAFAQGATADKPNAPVAPTAPAPTAPVAPIAPTAPIAPVAPTAPI